MTSVLRPQSSTACAQSSYRNSSLPRVVMPSSAFKAATFSRTHGGVFFVDVVILR